MPKTARQLDREIAAALGNSSEPPAVHARFTIHGAKRGVNEVAYAETVAEADRIARTMARDDFLITVLERDPHNIPEYRVVMLSNRENGKMKIKTPDAGWRAALKKSVAKRKRSPK